MLFSRSLASLSILFGQVVRGMSAGARVFEYMELRPRVTLHCGHTLPKHSIRGVIRFEGVTFAYPTRQDQAVLRELTLELPAGKVTALCGLSGAGQIQENTLGQFKSFLQKTFRTFCRVSRVKSLWIVKLDCH